MSKLFRHPGLINSSYVVFFHVLSVAWAAYFASYFPPDLYGFALLVNIAYPLTLFWFIFFIRQLGNEDHILRLILGYFVLSAVFAFYSAIRGPLADGELPVIRILFYWPFLYAGSYMSLIYASVIMFYGYVTYIAALICASIVEFLYDKLVARSTPKQLKELLERADASIDKNATRISDTYFYMNQTTGLLFSLTVVAIFYAAIVVALLLLSGRVS